MYDDKGGYITIKEILNKLPENKSCQPVLFTDPVKRILGFEDGFSKIKTSSNEITSEVKHPASLAIAIPDQLFIYSNLCVPYSW